MKRVILTVAMLLTFTTLAVASPPGRRPSPPGPVIPTVVVPVGNGNFVVNTGKGLPTLIQVAPYTPMPTCVPWPSRPFDLKPAPVTLPHTIRSDYKPTNGGGGGYGGYFPTPMYGVPTIQTNPYVKQ